MGPAGVLYNRTFAENTAHLLYLIVYREHLQWVSAKDNQIVSAVADVTW